MDYEDDGTMVHTPQSLRIIKFTVEFALMIHRLTNNPIREYEITTVTYATANAPSSSIDICQNIQNLHRNSISEVASFYAKLIEFDIRQCSVWTIFCNSHSETIGNR